MTRYTVVKSVVESSIIGLCEFYSRGSDISPVYQLVGVHSLSNARLAYLPSPPSGGGGEVIRERQSRQQFLLR